MKFLKEIQVPAAIILLLVYLFLQKRFTQHKQNVVSPSNQASVVLLEKNELDMLRIKENFLGFASITQTKAQENSLNKTQASSSTSAAAAVDSSNSQQNDIAKQPLLRLLDSSLLEEQGDFDVVHFFDETFELLFFRPTHLEGDFLTRPTPIKNVAKIPSWLKERRVNVSSSTIPLLKHRLGKVSGEILAINEEQFIEALIKKETDALNVIRSLPIKTAEHYLKFLSQTDRNEICNKLSLDQQFLGDQKSFSLWYKFRKGIQRVASKPAFQFSGWAVALYKYFRIIKLDEKLQNIVRERNYYRNMVHLRNIWRVNFINRQQAAIENINQRAQQAAPNQPAQQAAPNQPAQQAAPNQPAQQAAPNQPAPSSGGSSPYQSAPSSPH